MRTIPATLLAKLRERFKGAADGTEPHMRVLLYTGSNSTDISDWLISGEISYSNSSNISSLSLNLVRPTGSGADAIRPGKKITLAYWQGTESPYSLGAFWIDSVDDGVADGTIGISARNNIGKRLKEQTFDENNYYGQTTISGKITAILTYAGITDYYVGNTSAYDRHVTADATFGQDETILEGLERIISYMPDWIIAERYDGRVYVCKKSDFETPGDYIFSHDDDCWSYAITYDDSEAAGRVCVYRNLADDGEKIYKAVQNPQWWTQPAHRTVFVEANDGMTDAEMQTLATALASQYAAQGRIETFAGLFMPHLMIGDSAYIRSGDTSELRGGITDIRHNFGQDGFWTEFTADSGSIAGRENVAEAIEKTVETDTIVRTGKSYYGNRITRDEGFVSERLVQGEPVARFWANADELTMQKLDGDIWTDCFYYSAADGKFHVTGDVEIDASTIDLSGYVTIASLGEGGTTEIDGSRITTGVISADHIDVGDITVDAANITGTLTIGQLPDNVATDADIPTATSDLTNDSGFQTASGVTSIINGTVTTDYVEALGISVNAANITGTLTVGQIPSSIARTSQIPTATSQLTNNSGYVTGSSLGYGGTTTIDGSRITTGTISADRIDATNLHVTNLYTQSESQYYVSMKSVGRTTLYIGGDGTWDYNYVKLYAGRNVEIMSYDSDTQSLVIDVQGNDIHPKQTYTWDLGTESLPFYHLYVNQILPGGLAKYCGDSTHAFDSGYINSLYADYLTPNGSNKKIGTNTAQWEEGYIKKLYLGANCYLTANGSSLAVNGTAISDPKVSQIYADGSSTVYAKLNSSYAFVPSSSSTFSLGSSAYPWTNAYITNLYLNGTKFDPSSIDNSKVKYSNSVYASMNSSSQFVPGSSTGYYIGSALYPWARVYATDLYLNGAKLDLSGFLTSTDFSGKDVKLGGSSSAYIVCNTSRQLRPYDASTTYSCYLGTSTYYWQYAYIGSNTAVIGSSSTSTGSKIGFYGATAINRQTLSTTSVNMGYTSATASNYLTVLNNVAGILKKLGLLG